MNSNEKEKSQIKLCKDNQIHFRIKLQETVVFNIAGLSKYNPLADLRGGARDKRPPGGPNSFIFMQFSAKI